MAETRTARYAEPRWAPAIWGVLAWALLVSWMTMFSFVLTGDRVPALYAAAAGGFVVVVLAPLAWLLINRCGEEIPCDD